LARSLRGCRRTIGRVSPQDLLEVQGETLGIDAVRTIEEFLAFVPGSGLKYVLVLGADNLTPEAQNAFFEDVGRTSSLCTDFHVLPEME